MKQDLPEKGLANFLFCSVFVSSVSLWLKKLFDKTTTETPRTRRLHREIRLLGQSRMKQDLHVDYE